MKPTILGTTFILLSSIITSEVKAANFTDIYVFGDSLSDTGNLFQATGLPPAPYFEGRASNGPLWVEYLATDLGLTPDPKNNFAWSGSTTGYSNVQGPGLPGLQQQIDTFIETTPVADPDALYTIWAGANDYLGANVTDPTKPVNNLLKAVNSLVDVGAKNIMVVNLPDLGNLPDTNQDQEVSTFLTNISERHNYLLGESLNQYQNQDINVIPLDLNFLFLDANFIYNDVIDSVINNSEKFNFTNVTNACVDLEAETICNKPNEYFFWDGIHPTTNGHQIIGEFAARELESETTIVPEPGATFALLTFGVLGIFAKKKKVSKISEVQLFDSNTLSNP